MVAERQRRERETGKQMEELRGHLESLIKVVADSCCKLEGVSHKRELSVKLVPLTEKDDIKAYLVIFERIMAAHKVEKDSWPQYLAPQLTGQAQLAFAALPEDDLVERLNRKLVDMLSAVLKEQPADWTLMLGEYKYAWLIPLLSGHKRKQVLSEGKM